MRSGGTGRSRSGLSYGSLTCRCCGRRRGLFRRAGGQEHHGEGRKQRCKNERFFHNDCSSLRTIRHKSL